jgi:hypothetical protein
MFELMNRGVDLMLNHEMIRVAFSDAINIVYHVLSGEVDVGFIRMDFLDFMQVRFKIYLYITFVGNGKKKANIESKHRLARAVGRGRRGLYPDGFLRFHAGAF